MCFLYFFMVYILERQGQVELPSLGSHTQVKNDLCCKLNKAINI